MPKKRTSESISIGSRARPYRKPQISESKRKITRGSLAPNDGPCRPAHIATPTPSGSDNDEPRSLYHKPVISSSNRIVCRPKARNAKDPFEWLGDDEVAIIMSWLPAATTEILRRVSKLWKATSEYHNGNEALRRYYSHIEKGTSRRYASRQEANLGFRRRLYHEESLKAGKATRALEFNAACIWHINNNCIVWASRRGPIFTRSLDPCRRTDVDNELDVRNKVGKGTFLHDILLTEKGDIIVDAVIWRETNRRLMRLNPKGDTIWARSDTKKTEIEVASKFVVNRDLFYRIEGPPDVGLAFTARSLLDGSITIHKRFPSEFYSDSRYYLNQFGNRNLKLYYQGARLLFADGQAGKIYFFNTFTGDLVGSFKPPIYSTITVGSNGDHIWLGCYVSLPAPADDRDPICLAGKYDTEAKETVHSESGHIQKMGRKLPFRGCDLDRKLLFRSHCSGSDVLTYLMIARITENSQYETQREPFRGRCMHAYLEQKNPALVTLPALSTTGPNPQVFRRRLLEMHAQWYPQKEEFCMMSQDYLVYCVSKYEKLVVLSFWPDW